eukprot:scaffold74460_cov26-Phaeocystis_antarctica.AAC.1
MAPGGASVNLHSAGPTSLLASARPGAARDPPGGLGQTQALTISKGAGPHAHVAPYGRRWRRDTRRDLDAISTPERGIEIFTRSCRCQVTPYDPD